MRLHTRQWLLGPRAFSVHPDWVVRTLDDGSVLSSCPSLPVTVGGGGALVGLAVQADAGRSDPGAELADGNADDAARRSWAGRWALATREGVVTDVGGTMGCYYRHRDDGLWISSSVELLRRLAPELPPVASRPTHAHGMDWFPPPETGIPGIRRLLPTQVLRPGGAVAPLELALGANAVEAPAYTKVIDELGRLLVTSLRNLERETSVLWLPLTAGRDSRTLLAAAAAAEISIVTFTFENDAMSEADRILPSRLARAVGLEHVWIPARPVDPQLRSLFDQHTAFQCVDVDREYVASRQWDDLPEQAVTLGGGVFEVGRCYYHARLPGFTETPEEISHAVTMALPSVSPAGVKEWADWLQATREAGVDWRDRFYLEQRVAGWLGSVAQGIDITGRTRIHIASCHDVVQALLAAPVEARRIGAAQDELIRRMAPALSSYPTNPAPSIHARVKHRLGREISFLRRSGGVRGYLRLRTRHLKARRRMRHLI